MAEGLMPFFSTPGLSSSKKFRNTKINLFIGHNTN